MKQVVRRLLPLGLLVFACAALRVGRSVSELRPYRAFEPPTVAFPFGLGEAGVDLAALVSEGVLRGLLLSASVATFGMLLGTAAGAAAAFRGGAVERLLTRACDLVQAFPGFLLAMAVLAGAQRPTRAHLFLVFALTAWAPFCRLALAETQVVRNLAYVEAAKALGGTTGYTLWKHVRPQLMTGASVQFGSACSGVILAEASLSFVGIGPGGVALGTVLDQGVFSMLLAPHVLVVGAAAILISTRLLLRASRS
jgi:peptide/nickel transport system permease protein